MHMYMVDVTLTSTLSEEFLLRIPRQRAQVKRLLRQGRISSYALSMERSKLWVTVLAESETEVQEIVSMFPLKAFMDVDIHRLAFIDGARTAVMQISMN